MRQLVASVEEINEGKGRSTVSLNVLDMSYVLGALVNWYVGGILFATLLTSKNCL